jgi:DNA helicase-2/ATP-dependent DNA helicase PcrA
MKKLNKEQVAAIEHGGGPLLIIAGAGTGKTTVVTERIVHLVKKKLAKPSEILALTFTEKASMEMQERVDVAMPYGYTDMWISTFHGFCDRVLRDDVLSIGLSSGYSLLTKPEAIQFIRSHLYEFDLEYFRSVGNPTKFIDGLITHFSRLQDEDVAPSDYLKWVKGQTRRRQGYGGAKEDKLEVAKWKELAMAYKKYEELKAKEGYFDFGDLIAKTILLFRERPNVLREYQNKFKYILIDEFQDTNYAQFELSLLLSKKHKNITVVADDDQSIYHWRGASVSNVLQFRDRYPKSKTVVLTQNYRSHQGILDTSYKLIQHNNPNRLEAKEGINKKLESARGGGAEIELFHERTVDKEAERVVGEILRQAQDDKREWRDFAILVRANAHADPFVAALKYHGIPHQFLGPDKLFLQPEIVELVSYLKILTDQNDTTALYQVLSMQELGISGDDLSKLTTFARRKNRSLFDVLDDYSEIGVSEESDKVIEMLKTLIKSQQDGLKNIPAGKLLYDFLSEMEIMPKYINPDTEERQKRTANIGILFEKIKNYESVHSGSNVFDVVDWIELASEMGDSPRAAELDYSSENAVNILTIHSAKGLEFPVVFVVNLVGRRFPSDNRRDPIPLPDEILKEVLPSGDVHLQEERRLFYVALTRARDNLYLTAADFYGESMSSPKKLSPFIFEALGDKATQAEEVLPEQLTLMDHKPKELPKQMLKKHPIHYLSYSQIETFKMCPMHYRLRYILGVPTSPSGALSLGSSVHDTLKQFYEEVKMGKRGGEKQLLKMLKENWIDEGYISKSHEKESLEKAKAMLASFYKADYKKDGTPLLLEQPFVVPLKRLGEQALKIGGVIDRVDELPEGGIEIIDYKTGANVPSQKEVDKNLQLSLYALAATRVNEPPLNKKPDNVKLTLYYLDEGIKLSTTRTAVQLNEAVDEVFKVRAEIEESDFKCSGHPFCKSCEYKSFCRQN